MNKRVNSLQNCSDKGRTVDKAILQESMSNPNSLMRERHPDLFSDTRVDKAPLIRREEFEYYLETLTSRNQEIQFEHFCRKLAEKELCPNLRVQTGPTGGGDSKVDSETYPVAQKIAERWWVGLPSAGEERWAFAFSAKREWKTKVKSDVNNILSTDRDYKLIYFVTNQFAREKDRANYEDNLSNEAGIPLRILDRAWIVEKVFAAGNQALETYLAALGIDRAQKVEEGRLGPRDTVRLEELQRLDEQIEDQSRYRGARYQLVEDCLRSAILARSLEKPRTEVDGRFSRSERLAREVNFSQQRLRVAYNRAWTAFWWYEDYVEFNRVYGDVEQLARDSVHMHDMDLLLNLWILLLPLTANGWIDEQAAKIEARSQDLTHMLETLAADSSRPSNALQARTGQILMRIHLARHRDRLDEVEQGWCDLAEVVDEAKGLVDYSIEHLSRLAQELGEYIDSPAFDALYEKLASAMMERRRDGEAGMAYAKRGEQKMRQEKHYEAIQWLGRAEELLAKDEYSEELTRTLILLAHAFQLVGLLWAGRNKALAALDRTLAPLVKEGNVNPQARFAVSLLTWIEIKLGRIPHSLGVLSLAHSIEPLLDLSEAQQGSYAEDLAMQERVLGIHFLNLPMKSLPEVTRLPDVLERLGLEYVRMALLFALGQEEALRDQGYIPQSEEPEAIQDIFQRWQDQPATKDISPDPMLVVGKISMLKSIILGTEVVLHTPNNATSFGVAESLLGALEAFLATSNEDFVLPFRERMTIVISSSNQLQGVPQISFAETEKQRIKVLHPANLEFAGICDQQAYMDWLQRSIVEISCEFLKTDDITEWLDQVAGQERGFSRAMAFADTLTLEKSVFGESPRIRLVDWLEKSDQRYAVLRKEHWMYKRAAKSSEPLELQEMEVDLSSAEKRVRGRLRHSDRRLVSPIDVPLWDKAQWRATLFVSSPETPPILGIAFEDPSAGETIFRDWKNRWGNNPRNYDIRIAVIIGVSKQSPAEYAISIGPNLREAAEDDNRVVMYLSRIHRMHPGTSKNLDTFLASFKKMKSFFLSPARFAENGGVREMLSLQFAIPMRRLEVREAWQIGENDHDICVLHDSDDPIIPKGVVDPPVFRALKQKRTLRKPMS